LVEFGRKRGYNCSIVISYQLSVISEKNRRRKIGNGHIKRKINPPETDKNQKLKSKMVKMMERNKYGVPGIPRPLQEIKADILAFEKDT